MLTEVKRYLLTIVMCFIVVLYVPLFTVHAESEKPTSDDPIEILDYVMDSGDKEYLLEHQDLFPAALIDELSKAKSEDWEQMIKDEEERLANLKGPAEEHLTMQSGTFQGPSGKETYYNLDMSGVVSIMRSNGYSEEKYPYWVREDGVKMFGDYVMVAAELSSRPKGTILDTSLGSAIVCDTGTFAYSNPSQLDIAVDW